MLYLRKQVETLSTFVALFGRRAAHSSFVLSKKNCKYLCVYNLNLLICILLQCKKVYECTYTEAYFFLLILLMQPFGARAFIYF